MTNIKFPLTLSCGCKALSNCRCWSERGNSGRVDGDSPIDRVLRELNGAWRQALENYLGGKQKNAAPCAESVAHGHGS